MTPSSGDSVPEQCLQSNIHKFNKRERGLGEGEGGGTSEEGGREGGRMGEDWRRTEGWGRGGREIGRAHV